MEVIINIKNGNQIKKEKIIAKNMNEFYNKLKIVNSKNNEWVKEIDEFDIPTKVYINNQNVSELKNFLNEKNIFYTIYSYTHINEIWRVDVTDEEDYDELSELPFLITKKMDEKEINKLKMFKTEYIELAKKEFVGTPIKLK